MIANTKYADADNGRIRYYIDMAPYGNVIRVERMDCLTLHLDVHEFATIAEAHIAEILQEVDGDS